MLTELPQTVSHVKSGRIKPIAVARIARSASLPEMLALAAESGLTGFTSGSLNAVMIRSGMSPQVVQALNECYHCGAARFSTRWRITGRRARRHRRQFSRAGIASEARDTALRRGDPGFGGKLD